jgi:hypothetical protein
MHNEKYASIGAPIDDSSNLKVEVIPHAASPAQKVQDQQAIRENLEREYERALARKSIARKNLKEARAAAARACERHDHSNNKDATGPECEVALANAAQAENDYSAACRSVTNSQRDPVPF